MNVSLWGYRDSYISQNWVSFTIDFRDLLTRDCEPLFIKQFRFIFHTYISFRLFKLIFFCRWWQWLCAVVGPLGWHQWPNWRLHAGLQGEVPASQKRLCLLERAWLSGRVTADPLCLHSRWLLVVRLSTICPHFMLDSVVVTKRKSCSTGFWFCKCMYKLSMCVNQQTKIFWEKQYFFLKWLWILPGRKQLQMCRGARSATQSVGALSTWQRGATGD